MMNFRGRALVFLALLPQVLLAIPILVELEEVSGTEGSYYEFLVIEPPSPAHPGGKKTKTFSMRQSGNEFNPVSVAWHLERALNRESGKLTVEELVAMAKQNVRPRTERELRQLDPKGNIFPNVGAPYRVIVNERRGSMGQYLDFVVLVPSYLGEYGGTSLKVLTTTASGDFYPEVIRLQLQMALNQKRISLSELVAMIDGKSIPKSLAMLEALDAKRKVFAEHLRTPAFTTTLKRTFGTRGEYFTIVITQHPTRSAPAGWQTELFSIAVRGNEFEPVMFAKQIEEALNATSASIPWLQDMEKKKVRPSTQADLRELDPAGHVFGVNCMNALGTVDVFYNAYGR